MNYLSDTNKPEHKLCLRPNADVVAQRMGDAILLIHMQTNRIYELNMTAARLWEIINEGGDTRQMLAEFDISHKQLDSEIQSLVSLLIKEDLVTEHDYD